MHLYKSAAYIRPVAPVVYEWLTSYATRFDVMGSNILSDFFVLSS